MDPWHAVSDGTAFSSAGNTWSPRPFTCLSSRVRVSSFSLSSLSFTSGKTFPSHSVCSFKRLTLERIIFSFLHSLSPCFSCGLFRFFSRRQKDCPSPRETHALLILSRRLTRILTHSSHKNIKISPFMLLINTLPQQEMRGDPV